MSSFSSAAPADPGNPGGAGEDLPAAFDVLDVDGVLPEEELDVVAVEQLAVDGEDMRFERPEVEGYLAHETNVISPTNGVHLSEAKTENSSLLRRPP